VTLKNPVVINNSIETCQNSGNVTRLFKKYKKVYEEKENFIFNKIALRYLSPKGLPQGDIP